MGGCLEGDLGGIKEGSGEGAQGEERGKDLNMKRGPKEGKEGNFMGRGFLPLPLSNKFEFIHCNNLTILRAVLKNLSL